MSLLKLLHIFVRQDRPNCYTAIHIFTDSGIVSHQLDRYLPKHDSYPLLQAVFHLRSLLMDRSNSPIMIHWIPAHMDEDICPGNTIADSSAGEAANLSANSNYSLDLERRIRTFSFLSNSPKFSTEIQQHLYSIWSPLTH